MDTAEVWEQRAADAILVEDAVRRHAVEMLKLSSRPPKPGEMFPTHAFELAQWHLLRITALRAAPTDLAAAQLREEAMTALTTKEKPSA